MLLASLVLPLETEEKPSPAHLRGWFYRMLRAVAPELHDAQTPPPFTLGVGGKPGRYWLRLTFLDEALYAALSPAIYTLAGKSLRLGQQHVLVKGVQHQDHPWARLTTYPRLFQGEVLPDFPLYFASPTFFKRQGAHYPLPEPRLVFGSLMERFRAFAPVAPPDSLRASIARLTFRHLSIHTRSIEHEVRAVGFLGRATFHLPAATEEELRWLGALHRFAFFSGIGAKTSLGFGQARPYQLREVTNDDDEPSPQGE